MEGAINIIEIELSQVNFQQPYINDLVANVTKSINEKMFLNLLINKYSNISVFILFNSQKKNQNYC